MLYRVVAEGGLLEVPATSVVNEQLLESDLENWIEREPAVLGEDLLVIGRQVDIDRGKHKMDLLALDLAANLVVIELKRELTGGDADLQALRYAAMAAHWTHEQIRHLAEGYWRSRNEERTSFTKELDEFCDADYDVNGRQRVILAGQHVHPRTATTALWLRQSGVDVRVVEVTLYRDGPRLYLRPETVVPVPTEEGIGPPSAPTDADKEWKRDGRSWHLEQQLASDGRAVVEYLMRLVAQAVPDADGPRYEQKNYITWRRAGRNWIRCYTDNPHQAALMVYGLDDAEPDEVAQRLGFVAAEGETAISRVNRGRHGHIWIVFKQIDDAKSAGDALVELLRRAWERFSGPSPPAP